jgi:hypothetical protein
MFRKIIIYGLAILPAAIGASTLSASSPSSIVVKVEEDWELKVGTPDADSHAPQISIAMSPTPSLNTWHATFELNHCSEPYYVGGGVHLQLWNGASLVADQGWGEFKYLNHAEDHVHWTQVIEVSDGKIAVSVQDGTGKTWGSFGGSNLTVSATAPVYDLNDYKVDTSINESGVCLAGNRVHEMVLKRVRYTMADGSVTEDIVNRFVK